MKVKEEQELFKYLISELTMKSRNNLKSLLKYEQVLVNGQVIRQFNYLLQPGDVVTIKENRSSDEIDIIYEDQDFIAIYKKAGLLSVPTDKGYETTALSLLSEYCYKRNKNTKIFSLHRLDKDTSGVFIVAKSFKIQQLMQSKWNDLVLDRSYYAVVVGKVNKKADTIISNLVENKEHMVYSASTGKKAITKYEVIKRNSAFSLLDVKIETGRKNQIRVHFKEMGHPVVGDKKYGTDKSLKRLGLHAYRLVFRHPVTNNIIKIKTEMPREFSKII